MKLKLSCKSLDRIKACKQGKNSLLDQRSWFKNLFDIGIEVERHHLAYIETEDIKWFMQRFVLECKREDFTKIVDVIYEHVLSHGHSDNIIQHARNAKNNQNPYNAQYVICYMKCHDIMAIARKLLEIDYSCDYSNPDNWE